MDSAKNAVKDFMSKSGHHDTTVHEKVAPAVTHETRNVQRHEEVQTAIDKEVHQDHYHTSVQPVLEKKHLGEQHHHNIVPVEHRQFEHGSDEDVAQRLKAEAAQFQDKRIQGETRETSSAAPTIAGEHVHHHVHETIQPVVNRQTVEGHVVHTTVPIHEVHHNSANHHAASSLPPVSLEDFKKQGGVLTGREERYDGFEGEPKSLTGHHSTTAGSTGLGSSTRSGTTGTGVGSSSTTGTGLGHSSSTTGTGLGHSSSNTSGTGLGSSTSNTTGTGYGSTSATSGTTGTSGQTSDLTGTRSGSNTTGGTSVIDKVKNAVGAGSSSNTSSASNTNTRV